MAGVSWIRIASINTSDPRVGNWVEHKRGVLRGAARVDDYVVRWSRTISRAGLQLCTAIRYTRTLRIKPDQSTPAPGAAFTMTIAA